MTAKEEKELKKAEKLRAERERLFAMTEYEREYIHIINGGFGDADIFDGDTDGRAGNVSALADAVGGAYPDGKEYGRESGVCLCACGGSKVLICGVDEAGRGPFAGPVAAGAVILDLGNPAREILYLNDSKKLSEKKREEIYSEILAKAAAVGVGFASPQEIDEINILQATYRAMRRAIANLCPPEFVRRDLDDEGRVINIIPDPEHLIRPDFVLADAVTIPGIDIPQRGIIKGDAKSVSIAAGSIVAKVTRDHIMYGYDRQHPEYGFASNKGYGTAAHIAAIREHGMLDIHRRSFIHL